MADIMRPRAGLDQPSLCWGTVNQTNFPHEHLTLCGE
jgi:hypothetical protein